MNLYEGWQYLKSAPLFGLLLTLLAYRIALAVNRRAGGKPLLHSVFVGVLLVVVFLLAAGVDYRTYMQGASVVYWLLSPATVAMAVPLYLNLARLKRAFAPLTATLLVGAVVGVVSAAGLGQLFGLPRELVLSLAPRSVTTPFAIGLAEQSGGVPEFATAFVLISGVFGAIVVKPLFDRLGLAHDWLLGFSTGLAAHGVGTARAFQLSERAGAIAGLAMGLNGVATAALLPVLLHWMGV
ncbi:putative effector of murein hydrolase [Crenobacter luteus]|uniref:LrgB family protein n=1 Tax=Crenobacter luteus TaxID=1452487 RepID=UPI001048FDC9|nr:LrgB family protein [Crenobacter luteus]TCP10993.1 putative effector of murein hydrolase [Crenobacter luteus]